ncbi:MAG: restriction endonuclease subunit S, partial [Thaumarchaeota archaeon]|nr:restriction endonuclease subunit S [Nitrososphaerota archaeon]
MQVSKPKKGYKFVDVGFGKFEEILDDWNIHYFKDFVSLKHGFAFDSKDFVDGKGIKVVKIGDIHKDGSISTENLDKISITTAKKIGNFTVLHEDILIALTGATLGKTGVVKTDEKLLQNQRVGNIFPTDQDVLDKKFLFFVLSSDLIQNQIWSFVSTSAQPNIGKSEFDRIKFFKPQKLLEQQKIASILSNVDNTLEKTNQLIQKTKLLKKGLMQKLFTRGINHKKFRNSKIGRIPEIWKISTIDNEFVTESGGTPKRDQKEFDN